MHVLTYHFENGPLITSFLEDGGDEYIDGNDESDNSYDNTSDDNEDN